MQIEAFDHVIGDHSPAFCACCCAHCQHGEHGKCFNGCEDGRELIVTDRCVVCRQFVDKCACPIQEKEPKQ